MSVNDHGVVLLDVDEAWSADEFHFGLLYEYKFNGKENYLTKPIMY